MMSNAELDFQFEFTCLVCEVQIRANLMDRLRPAMAEHAECAFEDDPLPLETIPE